MKNYQNILGTGNPVTTNSSWQSFFSGVSTFGSSGLTNRGGAIDILIFNSINIIKIIFYYKKNNILNCIL